MKSSNGLWGLSIVATIALASFRGIAVAAEPMSPYGIHAEILRTEVPEKALPLLQMAGLKWCRTDFDWRVVEPEPGKWDFSKYDRVIAQARSAGITILPILYTPPQWGYPAHEHLEEWSRFVRKSVERYQDDIPVWEIWNEQNAGFWKNPNATNYCHLLKAAYQAIKSVNPRLKVAFGGLYGTPSDFVEGVYSAGGKGAFDILCVHPYEHLGPEFSLEKRILNMRTVLERHGDAQLPIWITEIGWATQPGYPVSGLFRAALRTAFPERKKWRIGLLDDRRFGASTAMAFSSPEEWPDGAEIRGMNMEDLLARMDSNAVDAVMFSESETFPVEAFPHIETFVKNGGTLIQPGGMVFWRGHNFDKEKGEWTFKGVDGYHYRARLRIATEDSWSNKKLLGEMRVRVTEAASGAIVSPRPMQGYCNLPGELKKGDRFIPLLMSKGKDGYEGVSSALYKYDSDWKGAVITCGIDRRSLRISEEQQSRLLPRALLISLQSGVERFVWYDLRTPETDDNHNESYFGIVHRGYQPKPAYAAYQTLVQCRPAGSKKIDTEWKDVLQPDSRFQTWTVPEGLYFPMWTLPDGRSAGAVWSTKPRRQYKLVFDGRVELTRHKGMRINPVWTGNSVTLPLDDAPLYFTGAKLKDLSPQ